MAISRTNGVLRRQRLAMICDVLKTCTQAEAAKKLGISRSALRDKKKLLLEDNGTDIFNNGWYQQRDKYLDDEIELLESMKNIMLALVHKAKMR